MYKVKKVFAAMMVGVLLLGAAITAHASGRVAGEPVHTCSFSEVYTFSRSEYRGYHPYVTGWEVNAATGQTTPVYSTCNVYVNYFKGEMKCGCGKVNRLLPDKSVEIHTGCGQ